MTPNWLSDDYQGPAIWRDVDTDTHVLICGLAGYSNGVRCFQITSSDRGIPETELTPEPTPLSAQQQATRYPPAMMPFLRDAHRQMLEVGSGIDPAIIAERGYRTVIEPAELYALGFKARQINTPGILIPTFTPDGHNSLWRYRPDKPRIDYHKNKPVKYEQPVGQALRLDIHPAALRMLASDPARPVVFVEGEKKADKVTSCGLPAVALPGVYGFKGSNVYGAVGVSTDFQYIDLRDRLAYIIFDSDAATNPDVSLAENILAEVLRRRGADVRIIRIPPGPNGAKQGADDFLVAGHSLTELLTLVADPGLLS